MFIFFPAYAFYGRPSQNDQPQANTTNGDSDSDIENEADWHDEPNLEGLAPRHRSKISQAMIIEVRPHSSISFPTQS